jgi:hypothetical protein
MGLDFFHVLFESLYGFVDSLLVWTPIVRTVAVEVTFVIFLDSDSLISLFKDKGLYILQTLFAMRAIICVVIKCSRAVAANKHFNLLT